MLSDTGFSEWHRLIDVIGRLSCPITPSRDIGPRYRFHECQPYRILFPDRTFYEKICALLLPSSRVVYAQIPSKFVIGFFNCSRGLLSASSRTSVLRERFQRQLLLANSFSQLVLYAGRPDCIIRKWILAVCAQYSRACLCSLFHDRWHRLIWHSSRREGRETRLDLNSLRYIFRGPRYWIPPDNSALNHLSRRSRMPDWKGASNFALGLCGVVDYAGDGKGLIPEGRVRRRDTTWPLC